MKFSKEKIIIYLQRDGFTLFTHSVPYLYKYVFSVEEIKDLEVKDANLLINNISLFISNNKLIDNISYLYLSEDIYFERGLNSNSKDEINNFLSILPFQRSSILYTLIPENNTIIALNKSFITTVMKAFVESKVPVKKVTFLSFNKNLEAYLKTISGENIFLNNLIQMSVNDKALLKDPNFFMYEFVDKKEKRVLNINSKNIVIVVFFIVAIAILIIIGYSKIFG